MSAIGSKGADNPGEWQGPDRKDWTVIKDVVKDQTDHYL